MSLDKAIEHGKEKRKPYKGAKAIACSCRNHGSCEWYKSNRLYQQLKMDEASRQALEEEYDEPRIEEDITERFSNTDRE